MELCKDCGKRPREEGKVRCERCSTRVWKRTLRNSEISKTKAIEYKGKKCEICGLKEDIPDVYDFHHVDPNGKEEGVADLIGKAGWDRIKEELDKCVMLCANCHRKEHYKIRKAREATRLVILKKEEKWLPSDDIKLKDLDNHPFVEIQEVFPYVSVNKLREKCKNSGINLVSYKERPWSISDEEELKTLWDKHQDPKLVWKNITTRSYKSVTERLKEFGLLQGINIGPAVDFTGESSITAYLYGVIWSKGGIMTNGRSLFISGLALERFLVLQRYTGGTIYTTKLVFGDTSLVEYLRGMGLSIRGSGRLNFTFPDLEEDLIEYFIRGYFEAKAFINKTGADGLKIKFYGNTDILRHIIEWFGSGHILNRERTMKKGTYEVSELTIADSFVDDFLGKIYKNQLLGTEDLTKRDSIYEYRKGKEIIKEIRGNKPSLEF